MKLNTPLLHQSTTCLLPGESFSINGYFGFPGSTDQRLLEFGIGATRAQAPITQDPAAINFNLQGCHLNTDCDGLIYIGQRGGDESVGVVANLTDFTINSPAAKSPSLYLTVNTEVTTEHPLSQSFKPTAIRGTLRVDTTSPLQANTIQLPLSLPTGVTTLQQAATELGCQYFDWVQTITVPVAEDVYALASDPSRTPLGGAYIDPVQGGYQFSNLFKEPYIQNTHTVTDCSPSNNANENSVLL
jgi:hypothetical protein